MRLTFALAACAIAWSSTPARVDAQSAPDGASLYRQLCAACHDGGLDRAPSRDDLGTMTAERVLAALESGPMISMATGRSSDERRAIAEFVTGKSFDKPLDTTP